MDIILLVNGAVGAWSGAAILYRSWRHDQKAKLAAPTQPQPTQEDYMDSVIMGSTTDKDGRAQEPLQVWQDDAFEQGRAYERRNRKKRGLRSCFGKDSESESLPMARVHKA